MGTHDWVMDGRFDWLASEPRTWYMQAARLRFAARAVEADASAAIMRYVSLVAEKKERGEASPEGHVSFDGGDVDLTVRSTMRPVAVFLMALAIENLLKGHIADSNPQLSKNVDTWGKIVSGHKLDKLCTDHAKLSPSKEDLSMLKELSEVVSWSGRYPVPTKEEKYVQGTFPGVSGPVLPEHRGHHNFEVLDALIARLEAAIFAARSAVPIATNADSE